MSDIAHYIMRVSTRAVSAKIDKVFGYDFFISYSQLDQKEYAQSLHQNLTDMGFVVFLDNEEFSVGDNLRSETTRRIRMSTQLVVICSSSSVRSKWVRQEVSDFLLMKKHPNLIERDASFENDPDAQWLRDALGNTLRIRDLASGGESIPSPAVLDALKRGFQARRVRARRLWTIAAFALLLTGTAIAAAFEYNSSRTRQRVAEARAYAHEATSNLTHDIQVSLSKAVQAVEMSDLPEARQALALAVRETWPVEKIMRFTKGRTSSVALVGEGKQAIIGGEDGKLFLLNWGEGSIAQQTQGPPTTGLVRSVALNDLDQTAIAGTQSGDLLVWNIKTNRLDAPFSIYSDAVSAIFTLEDHRVLTTGYDGNIQIVDYNRREIVCRSTKFHGVDDGAKEISSAAFSATAGILITVGEDKRLGVWSLASNADRCPVLITQNLLDSVSFHVAVSPDAKFVAASDLKGGLSLFELQSIAGVSHLRKISTPDSPSTNSLSANNGGVAISPDLKYLAIGSDDGAITLWDLAGLVSDSYPAPRYRFAPHSESVEGVVFTANSSKLVSNGWDGTIIVSNIKTPPGPFHVDRVGYGENTDIQDGSDPKFALSWEGGRSVTEISIPDVRHIGSFTPPFPVWKADVSDDGSLAVLAGQNGEIDVHSLKGWDLAPEDYHPQADTIHVVRFDRNSSNVFYIGHKDGRVDEWIVNRDRLTSTNLFHCIGGVEQIKLSTGGDLIGILCGTNSIRILKRRTYAEIIKVELPGQIGIDEFNFSPDGRSIVIASSDAGYITSYSLDDGRFYGRYDGQSGAVRSISYNTTGQLLAAADEHDTILVWQLNSSQPIVRLPLAHLDSQSKLGIVQLTFAGTTDTLISGSDDGTMGVWELNVESMLAHARRLTSPN